MLITLQKTTQCIIQSLRKNFIEKKSLIVTNSVQKKNCVIREWGTIYRWH